MNLVNVQVQSLRGTYLYEYPQFSLTLEQNGVGTKWGRAMFD